MTFLLKRARILDPSQKLDMVGDILLKDGKIAEIGEDLFHRMAEAHEVLDCAGLTAAPGLVDMHVHLRDPGLTYKEDLFSACRAAAAGGVTSLLAMPNTRPPMDEPDMVRELLERADANVYTCACVTKGMKGESLTDFAALKAAGAIALSDDGVPVGSARLLLEALEKAPGLGLTICVHCEDLDLAKGGLMHKGAVSEKLGVPGIPRAAEDCGTARELAAAASIGAPIHICHVSTRGSAELIRDYKRRGLPVTAETCPHYLLLTHEALGGRDADFRMNPPLRTEDDRRALIEALKDGVVDAVSTDHAPHSPKEKADFLAAPNGSIGMETSLCAALTALEGELTLMEILEKMSTAPARILGIPGGTLAAGAPADVVLFDPQGHWTVDPEKLHGKSRNTPFKGMTLRGRVLATFCRGRKVFDDR